MAKQKGRPRTESGRSRRYDDKPLLDLVGGIYSAVREPDRWDRVLAELATRLAASRMVLFISDLEAGALGFFRPHEISDEALENYRAYTWPRTCG